MELDIIHNIDALSGLRMLPDNAIDCIVTSPPYFNFACARFPPRGSAIRVNSIALAPQRRFKCEIMALLMLRGAMAGAVN